MPTKHKWTVVLADGAKLEVEAAEWSVTHSGAIWFYEDREVGNAKLALNASEWRTVRREDAQVSA